MALSKLTLCNCLALLMSEVSERCMSSGWQMGLEYILWDAVSDKPIWSRWQDITAEELQMMSELCEAIGGWIVWDEEQADTGKFRIIQDLKFVPDEEWQSMYAAYAAKQQAELNG